MTDYIGKINIKFGWSMLLIGIFGAALMGLFAFEPGWLGGYSSLSRRFLRLAHISSIALPIINIVYGLCLPLTSLSTNIKRIGSYSMILAAIFMPLLCLLCVFNIKFQTFFFIPVTFFIIAVLVMLIGQLKKE